MENITCTLYIELILLIYLAMANEDEMSAGEIEKIKDEIQEWEKRDKISEYIKQMEQVEDEMNCECQKIIAEMENVVTAKEIQDKNHEKNLKNIENEKKEKIEKENEEHEKIKDEDKKEKEKKRHEDKIAKIEDEAKEKIKKEKNRKEEKYKKLNDMAKKLKKEIDVAKNLKTEARDVKEKLKPKDASQEDKIMQIQAEAKEFNIKRRSKWDEYYMKIACLAALRSKDPKTPVRQ